MSPIATAEERRVGVPEPPEPGDGATGGQPEPPAVEPEPPAIEPEPPAVEPEPPAVEPEPPASFKCCTTCYGTGIAPGEQECDDCFGMPYSYCDGISVVCETCSGSGRKKVPCPDCDKTTAG